MQKKKTESKLKKEAEQMFKESHVAVILEDKRDDIKLIAEGLSGTNERIDRLEGRFDGLDDKVDRLEGRSSGLEDKVDRLEGDTRENFRLVFEHFSNIHPVK